MANHPAHTLRVALVIALATLLTSCDFSKQPPAGPSTTGTPPPTTPVTVTRVSISGVATLTRIGETSKLTATASLTDATTKDVTQDGRWTSSDMRVVTISPTGELTVVGFGTTGIVFNYQSRSAGITVTATPPGTVVITGRVREPGLSGVPNVRVVEALSGRSALTDSGGGFSIAELPRLQGRFKVQLEGYEPIEVETTQAFVDLPIQRIVRVMAGDTVKPPVLAPNDLSYTVGGSPCDPCRLIRVVVAQAGTVHVHVTWAAGTPRPTLLNLFAEGQVVAGGPVAAGGTGELNADVPVNAPREVVMYLGAAPPGTVQNHTSFTFETSMR